MEGSRFAFIPPEQPAELFDLGDGKAGAAADDDDDFHDDLFESISEAHYLPALDGADAHFLPTLDVHGESLLQSLVEKGCEDNQILGRLDRLSAQLSTEAAAYEQGLLADAPVVDLIERLESLESPSRSAAQGLLHLRHRPARRPSAVDPFVPDEVFAPEPAPPTNLMYADQMPELPNTFNYEDYEDISPASVPVQADDVPIEATETVEEPHQKLDSDENDLKDIKLDILTHEMNELGEFKIDPEEMALLTKEELEERNQKKTDLNGILEISPENMHDIEHFKLNATGLEIPRKGAVEKPTDLSTILENDRKKPPPSAPPKTKPTTVEGLTYSEKETLDKHDDHPKDLSIHRRLSSSYASPRRIDIPRVPSRDSDSMQSPQPSGIPAMTPSPTSKCRVFLENLYASTSPKMYTSEVTIQQCIPLNLGKHRKSASPTVSSCTEEVRNVNKDSGEPQEKRVRKEPHDLNKICNLLKKCGENKLAEANQKKKLSELEQMPPLKQLELLKSNKNFNLPDHMLVPRDRLNNIITAPGKEIPTLLMERFQQNMPEILQDPNCMGDPDLMVMSLEQIRQLIIHNDSAQTKPLIEKSKKASEVDPSKETEKETPRTRPASRHCERKLTGSERTDTLSNGSDRTLTPSTGSERTVTPSTGSERTVTPSASAAPSSSTPQPVESTSRAMPSAGHLADDIDAANAAAYQMNWLPYMNHMSQLEAFAACSQNAEFLKALHSAGYPTGYGAPPPLFHPRYATPPPPVVTPPVAPVASANDYRMQLLMWQEAVQAHAHAARHKRHEALKEPLELAGYAHHASKHASSSRYARPPVPAAMPWYAPRAPPAHEYERRAPPEPRPRISVKSLTELQQSAQNARRSSASSRRRDEPEVGSTTGACDLPLPLLPPHLPIPPIPHDPATFPLWHPLFSNQQKGQYSSPWNWTTVTATGD